MLKRVFSMISKFFSILAICFVCASRKKKRLDTMFEEKHSNKPKCQYENNDDKED